MKRSAMSVAVKRDAFAIRCPGARRTRITGGPSLGARAPALAESISYSPQCIQVDGNWKPASAMESQTTTMAAGSSFERRRRSSNRPRSV